MTRASSKLRRFLADLTGNATVELAMVMPIVLMMALGGIDFALAYTHKIKVQQYAHLGAEYVMGSMEHVPTKVVVAQSIADATGLPLGSISVTDWTECDGSPQPLGAPFCINPAAVETKYMKIDVSQVYTPILNIDGIADFMSTQTHTGSVTLRTK